MDRLNVPWPRTDIALRIAALLVLSVIAFGDPLFDVGASIAAGSRAAYLMVIPVLLAMIAIGRRTPPRGVSDSETDWIVAGGLGGFALLISYLAGVRFPTLAGLWNLPLISAVIWATCAATILFGARQVWQMRPLWLYALIAVTPLPSMLITAGLGGSNFAASGVAAILGAAAVFLASQHTPLPWRLVATACCAAAGVGAAAALKTLPLPLSVSVSAGVIPVACSLLFYRFARAKSSAGQAVQAGLAVQSVRDPALLPYRSPLSLMMLAALAVAQMFVNTGLADPDDIELARADSDWTSRAGLSESAQFSFIQRYLGPNSTFTRYLVPQVDGYPEAAIDVITSASLGALHTYSDVIWYPAAVLPNYRKINLNDTVKDALVLATDASASRTPDIADWYALSWTWYTGAAYQRVFVVVNQTGPPQDPPPPAPAPPSVFNTIIGPALWVTRQQADPSTQVNPMVSARAEQVVNDILSAAEPHR